MLRGKARYLNPLPKEYRSIPDGSKPGKGSQLDDFDQNKSSRLVLQNPEQATSAEDDASGRQDLNENTVASEISAHKIPGTINGQAPQTSRRLVPGKILPSSMHRSVIDRLHRSAEKPGQFQRNAPSGTVLVQQKANSYGPRGKLLPSSDYSEEPYDKSILQGAGHLHNDPFDSDGIADWSDNPFDKETLNVTEQARLISSDPERALRFMRRAGMRSSDPQLRQARINLGMR